jgi:16S rRNA processing protein RimM
VQLGPDEVELARIVGVYGTNGEVRVHLHNRESPLLRRWCEVVLVAPDGTRAAGRLRVRPGAGGREIGTLQGLRSREEAAASMGTIIGVLRSELPAPDEDEAYVIDLVGLPVYARERPEVQIGVVSAVLTHCPTPILEVQRPGLPDGWVPLVPDQAEVQLAAGRVLVAEASLEIG